VAVTGLGGDGGLAPFRQAQFTRRLWDLWPGFLPAAQGASLLARG
jgi:hypothetical protein